MASKRSSKVKPKKRLKSKSLFSKWKFGVGVGAAILLIVVVLFSKQIGQLLELIGVSAFDTPPTLTIELDPQTQEVGVADEIVNYDLIITEDYGVADDGFTVVPFTGNVTFNIDDLISFYPDLIEDVYFTNSIDGTQVTEIEITIDGSGNSYLLPPDGGSLQPPPTLTIVTKDNYFNNELIDFQVSLDLLWIDPNEIMPDEPIIPPPTPADGQLMILGFEDNYPAFTITVAPLSQEVDSGDTARYDVELTTSMGWDNAINIGLSSVELDSHITAHLISVEFTDNNFTMNAGETKNLDLIIVTQPELISQEIIDFTVFGDTDHIYIDPFAGGPSMVIVSATSNVATLIINPLILKDFIITLGDVVSTTIYEDELSRDVVTPGSSITYNIILNRIDEFYGIVDVTSISLDNNWPTEIDYYEFEIDGITTLNIGQFEYQGNLNQTGKITIYITDTEDTQTDNIDFNIDGYGDINEDGTPEHRPSNSKIFSIVDYTITIEDTPQTVGAGDSAIYKVVITPENHFNDTISLTMLEEDLIGTYPEHITGIDLDPLPINIYATDIATNRDLIIHTNPSSPGTELLGIPFHIQGDSIGLLRHIESNEGVLHIVNARDFTIQVTPTKNRIIPGGEATYTVTATSILGFSDPIDLSTSWDAPTMPSYILAIDFDSPTIMPDSPGTTLHITTTIDAPPISSGTPLGQFIVIGTSGLDIRFADADLDIVDFTIEITDPIPNLNGDSVRTIASGGEAIYTATVTRLNDLIEDIILTTDLISINGSIDSITFEGDDVFSGDTLEYSGSSVQTIILKVTTFDPIPSETINFYIYGDTTTDEGDDLTRQSNRGVLNITNDYGFNLVINPVSKTIAPTGIAEYIIGVVRLNDFEGDITLVSYVTELNGEQVSYNFDNTTLDYYGTDMATLTITADSDALGKEISFTVNGHADLSGIGDITYANINAEVVIIDFTIEITDSPKDIGPGEVVHYNILLKSTGSTIFTETVSLTTDIISIDTANHHIIETVWFSTNNISGFNSTTGIETTLNVRAFNILSNTIPNHSIVFTVDGNAIVDTVNLEKSANGTLNFKNTPYFVLTVNPPIVYSFPGDIAQFDVHIDRYFNYPGQINLNLTSILPPLVDVDSSYFTVGGQVRSYLEDRENDAVLNIVVTEDLVILRNYLHSTSENDDLIVSISGTGVFDSAYDADTAILRIRDFTIEVNPVDTNETYPSDYIEYEVILTKYNTYIDYDEDINLTSNVYRIDTLDHISSFNPFIDFDNGGTFLKDTGSGTFVTTMIVNTTSKADDLPITIVFDVTGTGADTLLPRTASNYLTIVAVPEFSLSLSPAPGTDGSGIPTETVDYILTLTRDTGFTDDVTISDISIENWLGQPLIQATPTIQDNNYIFSGTDTSRELYITLADETNYWGDYTVTVTGVATGIDAKYADADLFVMDFAISLIDNTKTVTPDDNTTYDIILYRYNGYGREVVASTSLTDLIGGGDIADVGFNLTNDIFPATTDDWQPAFLTVYTTPTATNKVINFTVTGTDNTPTALQRSTDGILNIISSPDYNLILTAKDGIDSGMPTERVTYIVTLETLNSFSGDVTITDIILSNLSNITSSFEGDNNILSGDGDTIELHLDLAETITWGYRTVQVEGTGSPGIRYSNEADLYIIDFDIQIDSPKNQTITDIAPNNVATYGITLIRLGDGKIYDRAVTIVTDLTSANYPGIISSSIFENGGIFGVSDTTTNLIVYAENSAPVISFDVTGTDTPTGLTRFDTGSLTINDGVTPDFLINIDPGSRTIEPGGATTYTVDITRINYWSDTIVLTTNLLTLDSRVESAEFNITELEDGGVDQATLSVISKLDAISSTIPTTFTVFGDSNSTQRSADADLIIYKETTAVIIPPGGGSDPIDFSITVDPDERTVIAGDTTTYTVIINRTNFTGDILLSHIIATNPNIKSATLDQTIIDNETRETLLTVITESGAEVSTIPIIINGTAIIDRRETERNGEAVLYIRREEEAGVEAEVEEIIIPEEDLPSTGPALTWLLLGLAALLMTTSFYKKPKTKKTK